jgi:hypothetical protein
MTAKRDTSDGTLTVQRIAVQPEVQFDPERHVYLVDGHEVPSVTRIIRGAGLSDDARYADRDRLRGQVVHLACEIYDRCGSEIVDPEISPYLEAWKRFRAETGFLPSVIERPHAHLVYRYAGTIDRIGQTAGPNGTVGMIVLDIKSGSPEPWHAIQLAAYCTLVGSPYECERWAVYLANDGTYKIKTFPKNEYSTDLSVFLSALNLHNWRLKHP